MSGIVQIGGVALASHDSGTDKVSLDSGTVFPAEHVIGFKYGEISAMDTYSIGTTDTFIDISLCTCNIDPAISGSRIFVTFQATIGQSEHAVQGARIKRVVSGASDVFSPSQTEGSTLNAGWINYAGDDTANSMIPITIWWVDTAISTATHTYTVQYKINATGTAGFNQRTADTTYRGMTFWNIMEIKV